MRPSLAPKPAFKMKGGYHVLFVLLALVMTGVFWWQLPPQIPLYYSLPYGPQQLADRVWFFVLPGLALAFFGLSSLLARITTKSVIYPQMIQWLFALCLFLINLAMIHIIFIVL